MFSVDVWWKRLNLLTFLSCSTRGGSSPQVMSCWICLHGPAAMLDSAHAASFCTLAFGCLISWGRTSRTPASIAAWVCKSEPLTMFPMERRAGVWSSGKKGQKLLLPPPLPPPLFENITMTLSSLWLMSSTSRGTMPVFTTTSIRSLSPSDR